MVSDVRGECVVRDGYCRIGRVSEPALGPCSGPSEWAHLGDKRRARTRGQEPEERHTTAGSLMACRAHHYAYDKGIEADGTKLHIEERTPKGADGPLAFRRGTTTCYEGESAR